MPDVNVRERGKDSREREMGVQKEKERSERATGRAEAARVVVDEQWNTGIPQHHISYTPLIPSLLFSLAFRFLLGNLSLSHRLYFKRL